MQISQRIYLESTVWYQMANYSASEFKHRAEQLFGLIEQAHYTVFVSNVVLEELAFNTSKYRERVERLLEKYKPLVLMQNAEADIIAEAYIENAFRERKREDTIADAYHAAVAVTSNITYMASYSYRNLLNVRILEHINAVNLIAGLNRHISILPPFMFLSLDTYDGEKGTVDESVWEIKTAYGRSLESLLAKKPHKREEHHRKAIAKITRELGLEVVLPSSMGL